MKRAPPTPLIDTAWLMERVEHQGECLEWRLGMCVRGPKCWIAGRQWLVRRLVWRLAHGRPPRATWCVLPICGNPRCVAPAHMDHVSRGDIQEGRVVAADVRRRIARGQRRRSRLTEADVAFIRASDEAPAVLDRRFGLQPGYASQIRRGLVWRDHANPFAGLGAR